MTHVLHLYIYDETINYNKNTTLSIVCNSHILENFHECNFIGSNYKHCNHFLVKKDCIKCNTEHDDCEEKDENKFHYRSVGLVSPICYSEIWMNPSISILQYDITNYLKQMHQSFHFFCSFKGGHPHMYPSYHYHWNIQQKRTFNARHWHNKDSIIIVNHTTIGLLYVFCYTNQSFAVWVLQSSAEPFAVT